MSTRTYSVIVAVLLTACGSAPDAFQGQADGTGGAGSAPDIIFAPTGGTTSGGSTTAVPASGGAPSTVFAPTGGTTASGGAPEATGGTTQAAGGTTSANTGGTTATGGTTSLTQGDCDKDCQCPAGQQPMLLSAGGCACFFIASVAYPPTACLVPDPPDAGPPPTTCTDTGPHEVCFGTQPCCLTKTTMGCVINGVCK